MTSKTKILKVDNFLVRIYVYYKILSRFLNQNIQY